MKASRPRKAKPRARTGLKPIDQCRTVAELLASPSRWTQGQVALTRHRTRVSMNSPRAHSFCLLGAIFRAYPVREVRLLQRAKLETVIGDRIIQWNDNADRTHAEVLAAVRLAGV